MAYWKVERPAEEPKAEPVLTQETLEAIAQTAQDGGAVQFERRGRSPQSLRVRVSVAMKRRGLKGCVRVQKDGTVVAWAEGAQSAGAGAQSAPAAWSAEELAAEMRRMEAEAKQRAEILNDDAGFA